MANIRIIKRRIRSVQNTAKITHAMEMIAASKMRRAQQRVMAARPYAEKMQQILGNLAAQPQEAQDLHPLMEQRDAQRITLLHITPDRGLTGGLTANLNRRAAQFTLEEKTPVNSVTIGRKAREFMVRHGQDLRAVFTDLGDGVGVEALLPVARILVDDYTNGATDRVYIIFAQFVSTVVQVPTLTQLLPVQATPSEEFKHAGYIFEPSGPAVKADLLPRFVEMQIYQAMLEAIASEQSARMVAMRNATDNAKDMISALTLELNKARQETITRELLDIVGGVAALEG